MTEESDAMLARLLAAHERGPDEAFARRVERLVLAEQRLRAARRAAWHRFGAEMAAAAALVLAFLLIGRLGRLDSQDIVPPFSPVAIGMLLLVFWIFLSGRAESGAARH